MISRVTFLQFLGKVGLVNRVNLSEKAVHIFFGDKGAVGMFVSTAILTQVCRPLP